LPDGHGGSAAHKQSTQHTPPSTQNTIKNNTTNIIAAQSMEVMPPLATTRC
jgi:hypothetical protein